MPKFRIRWLFFVLLLAGCVLVWVWTGREAGANISTQRPLNQLPSNERVMAVTNSLSGLADTSGEQQLAARAARLADRCMDLGFHQELQLGTQRQPGHSPEWRRVQAAEHAIVTTQTALKQLAAQMQKAKPAQRAGLQGRQQLLQAHLGLQQAELVDARQDLARSERHGAPATQRTEDEADSQVAQFSSPWRARFHALSAARNPGAAVGLYSLFHAWQLLGQKQKALEWAGNWVRQDSARLAAKHQALARQLQAEQRQRNRQMQQASQALTQGGANAPARNMVTSAVQLQRHAALLQLVMSEYDQRIDWLQQLAGIFKNWDAIAGQQRFLALHSIFGDLLYLLIVLGALGVAGSLITASIRRRRGEARRLRTMRHLLRFALLVSALVFTLLLIFGRSNQLFAVLGFAGAGLTFALQDMILSLCGWFVLIGHHGVSPGDWVEIDDVVGQVSGEVVEVGLLRTVLLETGNWTEAGHPTGRRVFFPNSYVFTGHYFNFTSSGQWLWDELQVQLPSGWDEQKLVQIVTERVRQDTESDAQAAEAEWRKQAHIPAASGLNFAPTAQIKPTVSGIILNVRYITTAGHRAQMRSRLYRHIYRLFGGEAASASETEVQTASQS